MRTQFSGHPSARCGRSVLRLATLLAWALPVLLTAKPSAPAWLDALMRAAPPPGEDPGLILEKTTRVVYKSRNALETFDRFAVRIDDREARGWAELSIPVDEKHVAVRDLQAWLVYPSGKVETFTLRDTVKVATNLDALRSDTARIVLERIASVRPGTVFAYEYTTRRKSSFLESWFFFQESLPTARSRFELEVPQGWTSSAELFNGDSVHEQVDGNRTFWEARDLPAVKEEPGQPPFGRLALHMAVTARPPEAEISKWNYHSFATWGDVAGYAARVQDAGVTVTPEIAARARELTAGTSSRWEAVRAIAAYAQSLNYVAVAMEMEMGGGHTPRPASEVFAKHWGDCKDMTALTRALLRAAGIDSTAILASIGEDAFVPDRPASANHFNHCIVGIEAEGLPEGRATIALPGGEALLVFDPTQRFTPVGALPESLEGTRILVGRAGVDAPIDLPAPAPEEFAYEREIDAVLGADGSLRATVREVCHRRSGDFVRSLVRSSSAKDLEDFFQAWVSRSNVAAKVRKIQTADFFDEERFELSLEVEVPTFSRLLGNDLRVFRPIFLSPLRWVPPVEEERTTPYRTYAASARETIRFTFPPEYRLEDLPAPAEIVSAFGSYAIEAEIDQEGRLVVRRTRSSLRADVPVESYLDLVRFLEDATRRDNAQLVLVPR